MSESGDWYCRNCGYITSARVTHSETCDQCHIPVEWHDAEQQDELSHLRARVQELEAGWIAVKDAAPDQREPVVYARPKPHEPGKWSVGIAYWTVSEKWNPEMESSFAPEGFTHWMPLPSPPPEDSSDE